MTTVEELKARKAWLLRVIAQIDRELEKRIREEQAPKPRPARQAALPGVPPPAPTPGRQPSEAEKLYRRLCLLREVEFEVIGSPVEPDAQHHPAMINTSLAPLIAAARRLAQQPGMLGVLERVRERDPDTRAQSDVEVIFDMLYRDFLKDPWAAGLAPPWPFKAFVSPKVFPKYVRELEDEPQGVRH